jgi:mannose-6-phosphate isomerase-like protein (cupin superfamily)
MSERRIESPVTGEVVEFVDETPEVLTMRVTWPRPGHRATEHVHPNMEETWRLLDGRSSFVVDGVRIDASAGTAVTAPSGRPHLAWNSGDGPAELIIEMRPGLRWAEFTSRFFAGDDPIQLLRDYSDEVRLPR